MKSVDPGILPQSVCFSFTPPELAHQLYFYPTWCGHYYCNHNYFMKRDTFPPLLIVFIKAGLFHIEYRNLSFDAKKGDVVLLDCTEPHYYRAHDGLEFLYMHFDGSNAHAICRHILSQYGPLIRQESNVLIGHLLHNMIDFYIHDGIESMFQSSMRIYHIFEYLTRPDSYQAAEDNVIDQSIHYIRNHVGRDISLDELASAANLSSFYYAHCFKQQTGFSPMEYVINTRMEEAKIQLVRSTKPIAEIGFEVGYLSSSSFINMFTKRTGQSPKQYRKSHQSPHKERKV